MPSRLLSVWSRRSLLRGFKLTRYRDQRGSDDFRGDALNSESRNKAGDGSSRYAFLLSRSTCVMGMVRQVMCALATVDPRVLVLASPLVVN